MTCKSIDLTEIEIGDEVYSVLNDWGKVIDKQKHSICVAFPEQKREVPYYYDGRRRKNDKYAEIVKIRKKNWEPKEGNFLIEANGEMHSCCIDHVYRYQCTKEGRSYKTKDKARKAYSMIRPYQRLISWILEHDPENDFKYGNYIIGLLPCHNEFVVYGINTMSIIDMCTPRITHVQIAEKLANDLNSGRLKL